MQQPVPAHFTCKTCNCSFQKWHGLVGHITKIHWHPKPPASQSSFRYHSHLTAQPCNASGDYLSFSTPPLNEEEEVSWDPFQNHASFEFAELTYKKMQTSSSDLDKLLELWAAHNVTNGVGGDPIFKNTADLHSTIDQVAHGDAPWQSFSLQYPGPIADDSPSWQHSAYSILCTAEIPAMLFTIF